jgi:hypothetical protein
MLVCQATQAEQERLLRDEDAIERVRFDLDECSRVQDAGSCIR